MKHMEMRDLTFMLVLAVLIQISVPAGSIHADTGYVSDMLILTLREGPGNEYNVIRTLRTDTPVELLEENETHLRVRTQEGEEGWVAKKYITSETPKPIIIAGLKKRISQLEAAIDELRGSRTSLSNELDTAKQTHSGRLNELQQRARENSDEATRKTRELKQMTERYNTLLHQSKNVAELAGERDRLKTKHHNLEVDIDRLNTEMEHLQQENARLKGTGILRWFVVGAGVFLVGLIIGKISRKKRYF